MNSYWKYTLFPRFLDSIKDCTYVNMEDVDLTAVLNGLAKSSIEDFLFPKCSLAYAEDEQSDPIDSQLFGYYFLDPEVGEAEYKVIIAFMKVRWVEQQIAWDNNFRNPFFDKDIKGYSPANMLSAMNKTLETFKAEAKEVRFNYNRVKKDGSIAWGAVNVSK